MRVLYLGYYDERCASLAAKFYLRRALKEYAHVISYGPSGFRWGRGIDVVNLERIYRPDVILLQGRYVSWSYPKDSGMVPWRNLAKAKTPVAMHFTELKTNLLNRIRGIKQKKVDMTLWGTHKVMTEHAHRFPEDHKLRWLPWSVDTDIFRDYGYKRTYDVAVLGADADCYPLRARAREMLRYSRDIRFFTMPRPSREIRLPGRDAFIHDEYARAIARSKILLFDTQEGYAIKKYYEGMACGALVMSTAPYFDADRLHFKPGVNYVEVNQGNFMDKVRYYLQHEDERKRIAANGYSLVRSNHSAKIRAKQLYEYLQELV